MKIGIFDLEPLYQKLTDGVELFDESELKVTYGRAKRRVMSKNHRRRLLEYERREGKPTIFDVFWGEDFEKA